MLNPTGVSYFSWHHCSGKIRKNQEKSEKFKKVWKKFLKICQLTFHKIWKGMSPFLIKYMRASLSSYFLKIAKISMVFLIGLFLIRTYCVYQHQDVWWKGQWCDWRADLTMLMPVSKLIELRSNICFSWQENRLLWILTLPIVHPFT